MYIKLIVAFYCRLFNYFFTLNFYVVLEKRNKFVNIEEFYEKDDNFDKYIDAELDNVADCFYQFSHGFFMILGKVRYPYKHLKDAVTDEYNNVLDQKVT